MTPIESTRSLVSGCNDPRLGMATTAAPAAAVERMNSRRETVGDVMVQHLVLDLISGSGAGPSPPQPSSKTTSESGFGFR
ncbi:MAG: hypothetical protein ACYTGC_03885 [Planctomycetota bacterium]